MSPAQAQALRCQRRLRAALRAACTKHELWSSELKQERATVPEMKEALMKKFGLEGSTASDWQQKREETRNAMAKFLLLPIVVAITSKIPDFDHKNRDHAELFMKEYRKKEGKGTARSRKST